MEISIIVTTLLVILSLGGIFLFGCSMCLINDNQIEALLSLNYELKDAPFQWAVKFVLEVFCLLNIVVLLGVRKATQVTPIQPQYLTFES